MNHKEFMGLPLESRKRIEQAILDLDKAVQDHHGISLLNKHKATDPDTEGAKSSENKTLRTQAKGTLPERGTE